MPFTVSVSTRDLRRAFEFYRDGLGFALAHPGVGDAMPEPVQFAINAGTNLMIVPSKGFSWVLGGNQVAAPGQSECVLGLAASSPAEVDAFVEKARAAGATIAAPAAAQPWGYSACFHDPDGHAWLVVAH